MTPKFSGDTFDQQDRLAWIASLAEQHYINLISDAAFAKGKVYD